MMHYHKVRILRPWLGIGIVLVLALSVRFVHLGADFPSGLPEVSAGSVVEEGTKVQPARNILLCGEPTCVRGDTLLERKPLIQGPYVLALRISGNRLEGPRMVNVVWSILLLLAFLWGTYRDYSPRLVFLGLLLLGFQSILVAYSRIATEVVPMTTVLYSALFCIRRVQGSRLYRHGIPLAALGLGLVFLGTTLGLTPSLVVYLILVLAGLALASASQFEQRVSKAVTLSALLGLAAIAIGLASGDSLASLSWRDGLWEMVLSPLLDTSYFLVACGLLCASTVLFLGPRWFVQDSVYRASLLLLVLLGPLVVGCFRTQLRYFVPLLPAYTLLILEWLAVRVWLHEKAIQMPWRWKIAALGSLGLLGSALVKSAHEALLGGFLQAGAEEGLSDATLLLILVLLAIPALFGFHFRLLEWVAKYEIKVAIRREGVKLTSHELGLRNLVLGGVLALTVLSVVVDGARLLNSLVSPSKRSQSVRHEILSRVSRDAVIAGDWAPYLTLGTDVLALYTAPGSFNGEPQDWETLEPRPTHFLASQSRADVQLMQALQAAGTGEIHLGEPILTETLLGQSLRLYPLVYPEDSP